MIDFGTRPNAETRVDEDLLDALHRARDWMMSSDGLAAAWQGYVNGIRNELRIQRFGFQRLATRIKGRLYDLLRVVDRLPCCRTFFGWNLAQGLQTRRQLALLPEIGNPNHVQRTKIGGRVDFRRGSRYEFVESDHAAGREFFR